jgi:hypothetical protein
MTESTDSMMFCLENIILLATHMLIMPPKTAVMNVVTRSTISRFFPHFVFARMMIVARTIAKAINPSWLCRLFLIVLPSA